MLGEFFGKVAIVTGAGSGIGRAICKVLVRDGAKVVAADKNLLSAKETISSLGSDCLAIELDVASEDSVQKSLNQCIERYKRPPTILVNSAGIIRDCYLLKMTTIDFDDVYKVNLKGTFLTTQYYAKSMLEYKLVGSIINISSIVSRINSIGQCNYAASKSGVSSLTQVAAKEFGKFNIRVNAILPGYIDTQMVSQIPDKAKLLAIERCPLRRFGKPEEVAEVVAFLASDKSSYVNGSLIEVTGGLY